MPFAINHLGINISREIKHVLKEFYIANKIIILTMNNELVILVCGEEITSALDRELSEMIFHIIDLQRMF